MSDVVKKGLPRVFVYGSLKEGHSNHRLLEGYAMLGRCYVEMPARMVNLGAFPGVIKTPELEPARIYGEVYEVSIDGLASLDLLEGHPTFYEREKVNTEHGKAWMYFLHSKYDGTHAVPTGLWRPNADEHEFWREEFDG